MYMEVQYGIKRTAAMVALRHGRAFLLLKRGKPPNEGLYVPVGGKIEPHERPIETAAREAEEEASLRLQREQLTYGGVLSETSPGSYNWLCFIYLAEIERIPPPICDEGELKWVAFQDIPSIPTPATDWHIYQYLMRGQPFALDAVFDGEMELLEMREEISGKIVYPTEG